ncbi:ATP-dependent RNA helicase HrpB [Novipirellula galeiformis]|uniref:ATP-dependent RNA helicase HrpB n=1 Tax=Novipirellula galeiformis TaxID=2528004 RepID=A0A5C6CDF1_9BACT|nr:ATP-dependent helicase HrpB [Novipirellula galeiformis]TWU22075.1 ATP-dependent RNA helicase HrpB [Novipirellula galeiformis]
MSDSVSGDSVSRDAGALDLPVAECLDSILAAAAESIPVVLKAPPGAGKTTLVPLALLQRNIVNDGEILLIQPRRLAARSAAARLAHLDHSKLGSRIGYHVRFDRCTSPQSKLIAMTTGMLLRRLNDDPLLENVGCVILDEFHERSLEIDSALGMLHRIRTTLRPELKLIVMSATLATEPIVQFLGDAVSIQSEGRAYPVEVIHSPHLSKQHVDVQVIETLPEALRQTRGHVLIFLPGVGEIRRTRRMIESAQSEGIAIGSDYVLHELYGDMAAAAQDAVLAPSSKRKIILSTNVAETSVTIPGVTAVIDSGLARVMRFNPAVGLPVLRLEPISQAAAEQRAGRAGRTEAGVCFRLWPLAAHRSRRLHDSPEIERADFSTAALMLAGWGERDALDFPWITPPSEETVDQAKQLLVSLGAIDQRGALSPVGDRMLKLPLHPRIARFLVAADDLNIVPEAALVAALLSERNPFRSSGPSLSLLDQVEKLNGYLMGDSRVDVDRGAVKQIQRVASQIQRIMGQSKAALGNHIDSTAVRQCLLAAYPDRVARRRAADSDRGVMVGGRGVQLAGAARASDSASPCEFFVCVDVDDRGSEASVRVAAPIEFEWLDASMIRTVDEPFYDTARRAVIARRRQYFRDLLLKESPIECQPSPEVAAVLAEAVGGDVETLLRDHGESALALLRRVRFLHTWVPELEIPKLDDAAVQNVLHQLCQSCTSLAQLQRSPWLDHFRGLFDYPQQQQIDRQAPQRITVPSGNSIKIEYVEGKPPAMHVKLQELFGWTDTPRIAGGKVPLQLHLLGPNRRPQQITDDLNSFWKTTYSVVRKELRQRYPKHYWPEDPLSAKATHNGLKPRD